MSHRPWVDAANRVFVGVLLVQLLITIAIAVITGDVWLPIGLSLFIIALPLLLNCSTVITYKGIRPGKVDSACHCCSNPTDNRSAH